MKHYFKTSLKFYQQLIKIRLKCLKKVGSAWFIYKNWQIISTIYKLFEYNLWQNCLEFIDKIDLTI